MIKLKNVKVKQWTPHNQIYALNCTCILEEKWRFRNQLYSLQKQISIVHGH